MILGIGTDIIEISRVEKALGNERFLEKYFTKKELILLKNKKPQSVAGNFCGKESVVKALGQGFRKIEPSDIEILRDEFGKPYINLYNNALKMFESKEMKNIFISISHCKEYAIANVIIEG